MTYAFDFRAIIGGQNVVQGATVNLTQQPGSVLSCEFVMTNVGNQPVDWIYMTSTQPTIPPPSGLYFPQNAFVSNLLFNNPTVVPVPPGGVIAAGVQYVTPTAGNVIVITVRGQAYSLGLPNALFDMNINIVLTGYQAPIPTPTPTPTPTPIPTPVPSGSSSLPLLALGALGVGAVLVLGGVIKRGDNG